MKNNANKSIGVFGSAFNPPHSGHLDVVRQFDGCYEKIFLVPSYKHAFGKAMEVFSTRLNMTKRLFEAESFKSDVQVLGIEKDIANTLNQERPVYTWEVLDTIAQQYKTDSIDFILGPDNADPDQWKRFFRFDDISNRWGLAVAKERSHARSSKIRLCIAEGRPIPEGWLATPVSELIEQHGLYRGNGR